MVAGTVGLFAMTEGIATQLIEPLLYGRGNGLSPLAVIIAAIFWSWLWGPVGLVLSTPLMLCAVTLGRHVERLEFLDVLFGDRPGLTPAENLYQRLLADDPVEALQQADILLKECSLAAYYDEAMLPGLQIAHADVRRGVVPASQLRLVRAATRTVIAGLEDADDVTTIESNGEQVQPISVLCIGGRGKLDDLLATIAVQLLKKHGFDAKPAGYEEFARGRFAEEPLASCPIVCVISFDADEFPSYLRNLLLRLSETRTFHEVILGVTAGDKPTREQLPAAAPPRAPSVVESFQQLLRTCAAAHVRAQMRSNATHVRTGTDA
jgi:hypothetical protein